jgi:hypothetical protein
MKGGGKNFSVIRAQGLEGAIAHREAVIGRRHAGFMRREE